MKERLFFYGLFLLVFANLAIGQQKQQKLDAFIPGLKGTGEKDDIILISTAKDLDTLSYFVRKSNANNCKGKYFKLKNDIIFNKSSNFIPIGGRNLDSNVDTNFVFSGNFDGNYYSISKFKIDDDVDYVGLFGFIKNATICKLNIQDANVKGNDYTAILCGCCAVGCLIKDCTIMNSSVDGNKYVATVLGFLANNSTIMLCRHTGCNILGMEYVGDICGYNENIVKKVLESVPTETTNVK